MIFQTISLKMFCGLTAPKQIDIYKQREVNKMLNDLTILKYARKGAMNEYKSARAIYDLIPCAKTAALVKDCEGTMNAIEAVYLKEKHKQHPTSVDMATKLAEEAVQERNDSMNRGRKSYKQAIAEAPYVIAVKWCNPLMGEIEYPCKSYKEAEESFEVAKREVHLGNVIEAHVFEQGEGQRVPVMGIMRGDV